MCVDWITPAFLAVRDECEGAQCGPVALASVLGWRCAQVHCGLRSPPNKFFVLGCLRGAIVFMSLWRVCRLGLR